MTPASEGLVQTISASAPTNSSAFLSPSERLEPIRVWISVVSLESRDSTSPERSVSKKVGSWRSMDAKTAFLRSATSRSPSHDTQ